MWLFTRHGMFSVVAARQNAGHGPVDPGRLQVRARSRRHLELLTGRFEPLHGAEILETPSADYRFRVVVPRAAWVETAAALAAEITYPNFKDECSDNDDLEDAYVDALHRVWAVGEQLQRRLRDRWESEDPEEAPR